MRLKPLLAVAVTAVTVCSAAPSAHAGWMTGRGSLPVFRSDVVCRDHMDFELATYVRSVPRSLDVPTMRSRQLGSSSRPSPSRASASGSTTPEGGLDPSPVVAPADRAVPFAPLYIDPSEIGGAIGTWPGGPGVLTHSVALRLDFNRWLEPGTQVRVGWGNWDPDTPNSTSWRFPVQACRGRDVHDPGEPAVQPIRP